MFKFRLQTVLELRIEALDEAEKAYLLAKSKRDNAETDLLAIQQLRTEQVKKPVGDIQSRLSSQAYQSRLEDEYRAMQSAIAVLQDEEAKLMAAWIDARKEVKAVEKLRENALSAYQKEQDRLEQIALDEWATMRKTA
jgi:flagellar export protein FliJ